MVHPKNGIFLYFRPFLQYLWLWQYGNTCYKEYTLFISHFCHLKPVFTAHFPYQKEDFYMEIGENELVRGDLSSNTRMSENHKGQDS